MDTDLVSTPAVSAPAADSAAPASGDPADMTQGNFTIAVAGLDLDVSSVVQESVVPESGECSEGEGDSGDGDGSGTPGPGGTSTDSNETTTMTTTPSSEESLSDKQEQGTSREQQLNEVDLEHLVDMGVLGGAVATVAIKATQEVAVSVTGDAARSHHLLVWNVWRWV